MTEKDNKTRAVLRNFMDAADPRRALFDRVEIVRQEITTWRLFMIEARAIRQAIDEWRSLDTKTFGPLPGDSKNE